MDVSSGDFASDEQRNYNAFLSYRKNISEIERDSHLDSAYDSGCNLTESSNNTNTPNVSTSNLIEIETPPPQRSNLNVIHENSLDSVKLTPVTQNINRICNFHITTPKSQDFPAPSSSLIINDIDYKPSIYTLKRSSECYNDFDQFQSTPKKLKIYDGVDDDVVVVNETFNRECKSTTTKSTPRKLKSQRKSGKKYFHEKLHSAPNLDEYFDENLFSPQKSIIEKYAGNKVKRRLPLLDSNLDNFQNESISYKYNENIQLKSTDDGGSIEKLLNCSNEQFSQLLNSTEKYKFNENNVYADTSFNELNQQHDVPKIDTNDESVKTSTIRTPFRSRILSFSNNTDLSDLQSLESITKNNNNEDFSSTKNFDSSFSSDEFYLEQNYPQYKNQYPNISTVLNDRLIAKKRANAALLAELNDSFKSPNAKRISSQLPSLISSNEMQISPVKFDKNISAIDITPPLNSKINDDYTVVSIICDTSNNNDDNFLLMTPPSTCKSLKRNIEEFAEAIEEHSKVNLFKEVETTDLSAVCNDNSNYNDLFLQTPPSNFEAFKSDAQQFAIQSFENIESKILKDEIDLPKTPTKLKSKHIVNSTSDREKYNIIYPTIPTTPNKKHLKTSPSKRKCQNDKNKLLKQHQQYKRYYDGAIYLDIIAKLEPYPIVLDRIFYYLTSRDLLSLTMSTKVHRNIIKSNSKINSRLNKYLHEFRITKENACVKSYSEGTAKKLIMEPCKKIPFALSNVKFDRKRSFDNLVQHSPPVSPSKKRFHENQKVVNILLKNERTSKCPRCAKTSRIYNFQFGENINRNNKNQAHNITSTNQKSDLLSQTFHSQPLIDEDGIFQPSVTQSQPITAINHHKSKLIKSASVDSGVFQTNFLEKSQINRQPYGECMSNLCNFKFCLNCSSEYHPDYKCLTAPISPTKEDIQNGILQLMNSPYSKDVATRSSKMMRRKSLKRLCF